MTDLLATIQQLQYRDRPGAERLLASFVADTFDLRPKAAELRPSAVSLNSFNGIITLEDGSRLFFKSHVEPDAHIDEYYNSQILHDAGYPVLMPKYSSTHSGKQILIYDVVDFETVFEVARRIELGDDTDAAALTSCQRDTDRRLWEIYQDTMRPGIPPEAQRASVHQLFYNRLALGRFANFYGDDDREIEVPGLGPIALGQFKSLTWTINGVRHPESLDRLAQRSVDLLHPTRGSSTVVGHGDAHNGNLFFRPDELLLYFDPAFAGRHDPLLDLAKPLFHNVFASWMYFPDAVGEALSISAKQVDGELVVEHDFVPGAIRHLFLASKVDQVLAPLLVAQARDGQLDPEWRTRLKAALFCCALLTMNLLDRSRFGPSVSLLGFAMAVEMGAESVGATSVIDERLDQVQGAVG